MLSHMLTMAASGGMSAHTKQMMGWGGHCLMAQQAPAHHDAHHAHGDHGDHAGHHADSGSAPHDPGSNHHLMMQQCCCGAMSASLAALPAAPLHFQQRIVARLATLPQPPPAALSPRYLWPSLNPRASPLV
ncbi:DUF2946 domain-containing protein [Pseudomonas azotifigens]|uniref:DUF2946 domain-containing protein n=1 Tax=Stutzerimonas azotifigens TaxID=291995 RepID=A0ABR5Z6T0_9GAMM|nr:DUF2946 domain-containing protein [Stutzerimonas azotifigens]